MSEILKELRTPEKQLLLGVLIEMNDGVYITVKNRGKVDYIAVEALITDIGECVPTPKHKQNN